MIGLPKKCEYALRAVFELAYRNVEGPVKIHDIANAQGVPPRFLEGILNELKHAGLVESRRGSEGGYLLAEQASQIRVADILAIVEGRISVAPNRRGTDRDYGIGDHALGSLWRLLDTQIAKVLESTTIADLVANERGYLGDMTPDYCI